MRRPTHPACKTRNWPARNEALKRRGSLTIWFEPAMTWQPGPSDTRGRRPDRRDGAIQICLTTKVLLSMAFRQTTGFVECLFRLVDLDRTLPDFSTLPGEQRCFEVRAFLPDVSSLGMVPLLKLRTPPFS